MSWGRPEETLVNPSSSQSLDLKSVEAQIVSEIDPYLFGSATSEPETGFSLIRKRQCRVVGFEGRVFGVDEPIKRGDRMPEQVEGSPAIAVGIAQDRCRNIETIIPVVLQRSAVKLGGRAGHNGWHRSQATA